jgi:hypothetical protein
MESHTKGEWYVSDIMSQEDGEYIYTKHNPYSAIARVYKGENQHSPNAEANAERIVSCVNACEGITNEQLKDMAAYFGKEGRTYYTLVKDMREAQKQRDDLLEALKKIASNNNSAGRYQKSK